MMNLSFMYACLNPTLTDNDLIEMMRRRDETRERLMNQVLHDAEKFPVGERMKFIGQMLPIILQM